MIHNHLTHVHLLICIVYVCSYLIRCQASITLVCIGIVAGDNGPTIFLLKGKIKVHIYDDVLLVLHVLKAGSTIIMKEKNFMTNYA